MTRVVACYIHGRAYANTSPAVKGDLTFKLSSHLPRAQFSNHTPHASDFMHKRSLSLSVKMTLKYW